MRTSSTLSALPQFRGVRARLCERVGERRSTGVCSVGLHGGVFVGVFQGCGASRPDPRGRKTPADLSSAEIGAANLGKNGGLPLLVEHEHTARAGRVLASWEGRNGELRVAGVVDCPKLRATCARGRCAG